MKGQRKAKNKGIAFVIDEGFVAYAFPCGCTNVVVDNKPNVELCLLHKIREEVRR